MGAVAFAVLISVEVCLAVLAFGRSTTEHLASLPRLPGDWPCRTDPIRYVSGRAVLDEIECPCTGGRLQAPLREPTRRYCTDTDALAKPAFPRRGFMKFPEPELASAARTFRARVEMLEPDSAAARCPQEHASG